MTSSELRDLLKKRPFDGIILCTQRGSRLIDEDEIRANCHVNHLRSRGSCVCIYIYRERERAPEPTLKRKNIVSHLNIRTLTRLAT